MPNYDINYNDERFKQVENEKKNALNQVNNTYDDMINKSDKFYQDQIDASKDYVNKQTEIQNENTQHAIDKINQQKEQETQDYLKEQSGAYVDWRKQSNNYGVNAEEMASKGLQNTGYSETSQVSMYNTYQNRIATSRESFKRITLNYDNAIKDAILANSSALLEIANKGLEKQLELALSGFQYKNTLIDKKLEQQQTTEDRYYSRWKDVLSQMNTENTLKENIRQYEANMAYQKERDRIADEQWQKEYNLSLASSYSSGRGSSSSSSTSSSGVVPYGQLANYYGDGNGNIIYVDNNDNQYKMKYGYNPYTGTKNPDVKNGTWGNYQPNNVNGKGLHKSGKVGTINGQTQNIWKCDDGNYYYWDGTQNKYFRLSKAEKKAFGL